MSQNPTPSLLDSGQIIKRVFNESDDSIRVDASITANISAAQEVVISHVDDSIKVGDGVDLLAVNNDGSINVNGPLTDAQLRASPVPVTASLDTTGLATETAQNTGNTSLSSIDGKLATLGQKAMSGSMPVVLSSDQSSIPVTGTFWQATQPVSASSLPLPSGAATDAKQDTGNTSLASIDGKITTVNTGAVTISTALPAGTNNIGDVDVISMPAITGTVTANLGTLNGAATDAKQDTGNTSLSSIDTKLSGTILVTSPGQENDPIETDNPITIAGRYTVDTDEWTKRAINAVTVATDGNGNEVIALAVKDFSSGAGLQNTSGDITSTETISFSSNRIFTIYILVSGTWTGSLDVVNNFITPVVNVSFRKVGQTAGLTAITENGLYVVEEAMLDSLAVVGNTVDSGTASISIMGYPESTGSHVWQAGAWEVTANAGTNLNTSALALDATLTGGTAKSVIRGGAKGSTAAADVTSTASGSDHQPLDVAIYDASGNQVTSFGGGTQYADGVARGTATGTLLMVDDGTNIQSAIGTSAGVLKVDISATTANSTAIKVDGSAVTQPISATNLDVALSTRLKPADTLTGVTTVGTITNVVHVDDNAGSLTVDNGGTFAVQATLAAGATNIAKAEDVASANADVGVPAMAVRKATPANTSDTDGDYEMLQMSAGRLWTSSTIDAALPAGTNAIGKLAANTGVTIGAVEIAAAQTLSTVTTVGAVTSITNALPSGTNLLGKTGIDQTTPGTTNAVSLAQIGTTTVATGNGGVSAGVQRVAIASDNTAFPVNATLAAETTKVIGTVNLSAAQTLATVTAVTAITNALPAGTNAIGKLAANSGVDIGDVDVTSIAAGTNRLGSVRLVDSADADLTSAKGSQTSRFVGVQSAVDSGRTALSFYAVAAAAGSTTAETAITLTKSSGTSATSTGNSFVITSGKKFRITAITFATRGNTTATLQTTTFNIRINTAGGVTTSSTPVILSIRSATPATSFAWDRTVVLLPPDGFEITGDGTLQFGVTAAATYVTNAPTWDVNIMGFEY